MVHDWCGSTPAPLMPSYFAFIRANARFLAFGFLLTLGSSFGQTFFVSLFGVQIRTTFGLSDGEFGLGYSLATLASGLTLVWLGKRIDDVPLPRYSSLVCLGLALSCAAMALAPAVPVLFAAFFGLRLAGQGLMTHTSVTAMARYFDRDRGKAISVAFLGLPIGGIVLPLVAVAAIAAIGWRETWAVAAALLALGFLPAMRWCLRGHERMRAVEGEETDPPPPESDTSSAAAAGSSSGIRQWTRAEVARDLRFYLIVLGVIASPAILTGTIFHQARLATEKGWDIALLAAGFGGLSVVQICVSLLTGVLVDRFGATRVMPWTLAPLFAALVVLGLSDDPAAGVAYLVLAGANIGAQMASTGAMWAELYGVRHIGAIRALITAIMMFSTALAPVGMGALIDMGVRFDTIVLGCAGYIVVAMLLLWRAARR